MIFLFEFHAEPNVGTTDRRRYGGAIVLCWISKKTKAKAHKLAQKMIQDARWHIVESQGGGRITKATQNPEGMKYFDQARIDKTVAVFHLYPRKKKKLKTTQNNGVVRTR